MEGTTAFLLVLDPGLPGFVGTLDLRWYLSHAL